MLIYPGSFNPLHRKHIEIALLAEKISGQECEFEICDHPCDKTPLSEEDRAAIVEQFIPLARTVHLTDCTTFHSKVMRFPGATFVLGADTLDRIMDVKYYDSVEDMEKRVWEIASASDFIVFPRGKSLYYADLPLILRRKCIIPYGYKYEDISSTQIRNNNATTSPCPA